MRTKLSTRRGWWRAVLTAAASALAFAAPAAAEETIIYFHQDALGSVRLVTGNDGEVLARHDYLPFGEEVPAGQFGRAPEAGYGAVEVAPQHFTGKERDPESDLDYFGARYYSGAMGRFTSVDPALSSGRIAAPQSWNRYAYVLGNPFSYIDPHGLWDLDIQQNTDKKGRPTVEVYVAKSNEDDDAESLAKQLGLSSEDAKAWVVGDKVRLSSLGGITGGVFKKVEGGLTDQVRWVSNPKNAGKITKGEGGPSHSDCSRTAAEVAGLSFAEVQVGTNTVDGKIASGEARAVGADRARVGDMIRFAGADNGATHFASFAFRRVDGQAIAYSKNGTTGPYRLTPVESLQLPLYGTVRGLEKSDSGYYRGR